MSPAKEPLNASPEESVHPLQTGNRREKDEIIPVELKSIHDVKYIALSLSNERIINLFDKNSQNYDTLRIHSVCGYRSTFHGSNAICHIKKLVPFFLESGDSDDKF